MDYDKIVQMIVNETMEVFAEIANEERSFRDLYACHKRVRDNKSYSGDAEFTLEDRYDSLFDRLERAVERSADLTEAMRRGVEAETPDRLKGYPSQWHGSACAFDSEKKRVDRRERKKDIVTVCECGHECRPCEAGYLHPRYAREYDRTGGELINLFTDVTSTAKRVVDADKSRLSNVELFMMFDDAVAKMFFLLGRVYRQRSRLRAVWRKNERDFDTFMYISDKEKEWQSVCTKQYIQRCLDTQLPSGARSQLLKTARRVCDLYRDEVEEFRKAKGRITNGAAYHNIEWRMLLRAVQDMDMQTKEERQ